MPLHLSQTNNAAELYAAVLALQIVPNTKITICTYSEYVLLGAQGAAKRWQCRGWRGSSGKVSCVDLWQTLLPELSNPDREILWVKVPLHVDVPGNEEADRLSRVGRMSHPLFPTKATRALQVITTPATPKVKKAKHKPLPEAPHTPLLPKILDFSFFAILSPEPALVPCDNTHELWNALGMQPMPGSPRDSVHSDCSCSTDCSCELHTDGHNGPT